MSLLMPAFWLAVLHFLCDFHLQSDFVARAKTPGSGLVWPWVMTAHAAVHGGAVALVLGPVAGGAEALSHWIIDYAKARGWLGKGDRGFVLDQAIHLGCKALWLVLFPAVGPLASLSF